MNHNGTTDELEIFVSILYDVTRARCRSHPRTRNGCERLEALVLYPGSFGVIGSRP